MLQPNVLLQVKCAIQKGGLVMAYKIAVGSSDGVNIDLKFGEVTKFLIYEITDTITLAEERAVSEDGCGGNNGACCGNGKGCNGLSDVAVKVELISDCRCVVCKKVGFQAQKQFEKKAISVFDVDCKVEEALKKISFYFDKIDNHEVFRR